MLCSDHFVCNLLILDYRQSTDVSTNDVLTSSFFNIASARIGVMGMDCRGRVKGADNQDLAGNVSLCRMPDYLFPLFILSLLF